MKTRIVFIGAVCALLAFSLPAHGDVVISSFDTPVTLEFTHGMYFGGAGLTPGGASGLGMLDSNTILIVGLSDGDTVFGGTYSTGDFARGLSTGGVATGGLYAFNTGSDIALGFQPTGSDVTPGRAVFRIRNNTGSTINQLEISAVVAYYDDAARSTRCLLEHSGSVAGSFSLLQLTDTPLGPSVAPAWISTGLQGLLPNITIAHDDHYYAAFGVEDAAGTGARDEVGILSLTVKAVPEPATLALLLLGGLALLRHRSPEPSRRAEA